MRAAASGKRRRWLKNRYRGMQYDARFADGREEFGVDLTAVLQQVCVVAVAKENLRVGPGESGIQMRDDSDLVVTSDGGEDGPDGWVPEGRI